MTKNGRSSSPFQDGGAAIDQEIPNVTALLIEPDGSLLAAAAGALYRITPDRMIHKLRTWSGFAIARSAEGNLYGAAETWEVSGLSSDEPEPVAGIPSTKRKSFGQASAVDSQGRYYTPAGSGVLRFSASGEAETVAGNGKTGFTEDGTVAVEAALMPVTSVTVDRSDKVYFSEMLNHKVRMASPDGVLRTALGNGGMNGRYDDPSRKAATSVPVSRPTRVLADSQGNLIVVCDLGIVRVNAGDGLVKLIYSSIIGTAGAIAVDAQDNLIAAIQPRSLPAGRELYRIAPDGARTLLRPSFQGGSIAFDAEGAMYWTMSHPEMGSLVIRSEQDGSDGIIARGSLGIYVDGGEPLSSAYFSSISSLLADSSGNLIIGDGSLGAVRIIRNARSCPSIRLQ